MEEKILRYNISGIRGVVGDTLTPDVLYYNIAAFVKYLEKRSFLKGEKQKIKIFVGRDGRNSGEAISIYVLSLLNLMGVDVDFGGIIPTPTVLHEVKKGKYDGGIAITASHNPIQYNAIKLCKFGGYFLDQKDILELNGYIDELLNGKDINFADYKNIGITRLSSDAFTNHIDEAISKFDVDLIKSKKFKVAVDFCNSTAANVFPPLFEKLNVSYKSIFDKITGYFEREPEPNSNTMKHLSNIMKDSDFDVGFVFDPDADRVAVLFEDGSIPSEEYTLALSYLHYCKNKGGGDCVVNLSTSSMVKYIADKYGHNVFFAPVGEINVTNAMLKNKAIFGGEGNGGVIYFPVSNSRDTIVAVLFILELIAKENKKISSIAEFLPKYRMRKYKFEKTKDFDIAKAEELKNIFEKNSFKVIDFNTSDGIRFNFSCGFCHIRPSNTEPVIRIILENSDEKLLEIMELLIPEMQKIL
mgnify:CR=1 FL=1